MNSQDVLSELVSESMPAVRISWKLTRNLQISQMSSLYTKLISFTGPFTRFTLHGTSTADLLAEFRKHDEYGTLVDRFIEWICGHRRELQNSLFYTGKILWNY